jgi:hypothetical protein
MEKQTSESIPSGYMHWGVAVVFAIFAFIVGVYAG